MEETCDYIDCSICGTKFHYKCGKIYGTCGCKNIPELQWHKVAKKIIKWNQKAKSVSIIGSFTNWK